MESNPSGTLEMVGVAQPASKAVYSEIIYDFYKLYNTK
jgi:hypothetical protein